jgi:hypothetical protein
MIVASAEGIPVSGTMRADGVVDIGDHCTHCGCDTSPGSGAWVNRVPSGSATPDGEHELDGWLCAECQTMTCDECGESVLDWTMTELGVVCDECGER